MSNYLITHKRILLIEDNVLCGEIALEVLSSYGARVDFAFSGENALDIIKKHEPHYYSIILVDIGLPGINGYTTADKIREISGYQKGIVKIIGLSASPYIENTTNSLDGYCRKPMDINELVEILK